MPLGSLTVAGIHENVSFCDFTIVNLSGVATEPFTTSWRHLSPAMSPRRIEQDLAAVLKRFSYDDQMVMLD
jgi:hypothetical protein